MPPSRFRKRPGPEERDQIAARYVPGGPLDDLAEVAHLVDKPFYAPAALREVDFGDGPVLIVRYWRGYDDHPSQVEYQAVEPGQWLAYSPDNDFLYDSDDANWQHWYQPVSDGT